MKKYLLTTAILFGAITMNAQADCAKINSGGGYCVGKGIVQTLYPTAVHTYVGTTGNEKVLKCTPIGNGSLVYLKKTHKNYQTIYSTLLASMMDPEKTVNLRIVPDSTGKCQIAYITINK